MSYPPRWKWISASFQHPLLGVGLLLLAVVQLWGSKQDMGVPQLSYTCELPDYVDQLPENIRDELQGFHGLVLLRSNIREVYPFLPYIFFNSGSAEVPDRYILFTTPEQTANFNEHLIPGGTLQKHYHMLNIIAARLLSHPAATITITGCNSHQPKMGEIPALSKQRAERIRQYLVDIWGIESKRIRLASRTIHSSGHDTLTCMEYQRVEFASDDANIIGPVIQEDRFGSPLQEFVHFQMRNGAADDKVISRRIEIYRNGTIWNVITDSAIGLTATESQEYNWGRGGDENDMPLDDEPFVAQLVVQLQDGIELRSAEVIIPVRSVGVCNRTHCFSQYESDRYSVLLFSSGEWRLTSQHINLIKTIITQALPDSVTIYITGYADDGLPDANEFRLSERRAEEVEKVIRDYAPVDRMLSIEGKGVGNTSQMYYSHLPEERCFNRTVQVQVVYRHKYWWENWE